MNHEHITAMATIMVEARQAHEDVGDLITAALHAAANQLGGASALVAGRPGSWEADIVLRMAAAGGEAMRHRVDALSLLFVEMGKEGADGGDVLSQAMGEAVDELGGLDAFVGQSTWYWDIRNIGCQHSKYWDQY